MQNNWLIKKKVQCKTSEQVVTFVCQKLKAVYIPSRDTQTSPEISNIHTLSEFLTRHLDSHGVENDTVRLLITISDRALIHM